jgi:Protein of unknown function (DUF3311)
MRAGKALWLTVLVIAVYVLHQDFWNWKKVEPLVFGFLPIGLAYHAAYSVLASILLAILVRFAWPKHLEEESQSGQETTRGSSTEGH